MNIWPLLLILLFLPTASFGMTATQDAKARMTLTTPLSGTTYQWYKDGVQFSTTTTGTVVDQRPNKNYKYYQAQDTSIAYTGSWSNYYNAAHLSASGNAKRTTTTGNSVTITTTSDCVEIGVLLDVATVGGTSTSTNVSVTFDGVSQGQIHPDMSNTSSPQYSVIRWGKSGITPGSAHTIVFTLLAGPSLTIDGYWASNRSVALGQTVNYSVTVNGTLTDSVTSPAIKVDRAAVMNAYVDSIVALFNQTPVPYNLDAGYAYNEYMGALAMAYKMTGREELRACATKVYNAYVAYATASGLLLNGGTGDYHIVNNGRTGYNYWLAYKIFGNAEYLAVADQITGYFRNTWPRNTVSYNSVSYPNVWCRNSAGAAPIVDGNQYSTPAFSCALLYNEPASAYYHDATLLTYIKANVDWSLTVYNAADGTLGYSNLDMWPGRIYGTYQWIGLQWIAANLGYRTTEATAITNWLGGYPTAEPWFWEDSTYDWSPNAETIMWQASATYLKNGSVPSEFVDLAFTAATDNAYMEYSPGTSAAPAHDMVDLLYRNVFLEAAPFFFNNAPLSVYGAASAATVGIGKAIANMVANFR